MSEQATSTVGLFWKEVRQLRPLVLILIASILLLMLLWSMMSFRRFHFGNGQFIPLLLPALFAAGAAAILVGQEREQRTLWWLASLPVAPSQLIRVKFAAALGGLASMWLLSWTLMILMHLAGNRGTYVHGGEWIEVIFLHLHSVYILLCGFYTAWRIRNSFASLVAIIPLAVMPFIVVQLGYLLRTKITGLRFVEPTESALHTLGVTILAIVVVGWLAYRAACQTLAPAEPPALTSRGPASWLDAWQVGPSNAAPTTSFRYPISSLVWQSIHHNPLTLLAVTLTTMLGMFGLLAIVSFEPRDLNAIIVLATVAVLLGVSWLGVFVFSGDGSETKLRFLAERGISPTRVLFGRQLIGISILSSLVLLYAVCSIYLPSAVNQNSFLIPSAALVALTAWVIYATSQWTSQVIRTLAASALLAPVISLLVVYWLTVASVELDAPLWLIVVTGSLPMFATWLMMHRFMEGNRRGWIWATAVITACLIGLLPLLPVLVEVSRIPRMPAALRNKFAPHPGSPLPITIRERPEKSSDPNVILTTQESLALLEQRSFRPSDLVDIPNPASDDPLTIDRYVLRKMIDSASLDRLAFETSPNDEARVEALGEWIETFAKIAKRLRSSSQWWNQESADQIEIWLTQTLSTPAARELRNREFYRLAVGWISDSTTRTEARRRSVLSAWSQYRRPHGAYQRRYLAEIFAGHLPTGAKRYWIADRTVEAFAHAALRLIEEGSAGRPTESIRRQLHSLLIGPGIAFADGCYSDRLQVSADSTPLDDANLYPASQWYAPWEADAKALVNPKNQVTSGAAP